MADDPELVMIQAPWLMTDETRDGAVIGKFYDFDEEWRFESGQYGNCLAFVIQNHVFPECWLLRRDALPSIAGPTPRFTYSYFCMLAQALSRGAVLFSPQPHILATAVSKGFNSHVGNSEAMESWDVYRGGLELMASHARQFNPGALPEPSAVGAAIQGFVCERMAVAARLQAHAKNWANAYQILRRLHAYEMMPQVGVTHDDIARLAAVETALLECAQLGADVIVASDGLPDHVLERMNPLDGVRIVRAGAGSPDDGRRAYFVVGHDPDRSMRDGDVVCDLVAAMERFPIFPTP